MVWDGKCVFWGGFGWFGVESTDPLLNLVQKQGLYTRLIHCRETRVSYNLCTGICPFLGLHK